MYRSGFINAELGRVSAPIFIRLPIYSWRLADCYRYLRDQRATLEKTH
jgi:hypothetical protein